MSASDGLSYEEAVLLTKSIRANLDSSASLIKKAADGRAWEAMGYTSFKDWLENAVGISRSRAYQLLNIAHLEDELASHLTLPDYFTISDRNTRLVMKYGRDRFIKRLVKAATSDKAANAVLVEETLADIRGDLEAGAAPGIETDPDGFAEAFFNQFSLTVDDLPTPEEVEYGHEEAVLMGLKMALEHIDRAMNRYTEVLGEVEK